MGRISKVIYALLDPSIYTVDDANDIYWYQNMMGLNKMTDEDYIEYQTEQLKVRNAVMLRLMIHNNARPKVSSVIFGPSMVDNKVMICAEV